jgi:hypothetical protein
LAFEKVGPGQNIVAVYVAWGLAIVDENKFGRAVL